MKWTHRPCQSARFVLEITKRNSIKTCVEGLHWTSLSELNNLSVQLQYKSYLEKLIPKYSALKSNTFIWNIFLETAMNNYLRNPCVSMYHGMVFAEHVKYEKQYTCELWNKCLCICWRPNLYTGCITALVQYARRLLGRSFGKERVGVGKVSSDSPPFLNYDVFTLMSLSLL
jgi:hypothetical protein